MDGPTVSLYRRIVGNAAGARWRQVRTRKDWACESCGRRLPRGSLVWTATTAAADDRYTVRYPPTWRFCDSDAAAVREGTKQPPDRMAAQGFRQKQTSFSLPTARGQANTMWW